MEKFEVIVIGAGHAGCEAALAAARLGCRTLLLTVCMENIAFMPCNPSIGGPGKAHLVREIDALGGEMAQNIDKTQIQLRMLNTSKGPAVQALRAQADKRAYQKTMRVVLEQEPKLSLRQATISKILIKGNRVVGVETETGMRYAAQAVILATGTFLRGLVHIGEFNYASGPIGQPSVQGLSQSLLDLGFKLVRFKTGTSPRISARSIDFSKMQRQDGDPKLKGFSFLNIERERPCIPCWLTYTNEETKVIIEDNLARAPMYSGQILGTGPRYCPSIETKFVQFPKRVNHQVFIEPEGLDTEEMYISGLSTSLPEEVQWQMVHSVAGLENAEIIRPGYAIEYDALVATQLEPSLAHKEIRGLFAAGQVNGTSGYEEAAAQGLIAGINAAAYVHDKEPFVLSRGESYIGVLIDDLVTKETEEPYRMMTARAEYRLLLRQNNADLRLTEKGYQLGLVTPTRYALFQQKQKAIEAEYERLTTSYVKPGNKEIQALLQARGTSPIDKPTTLAGLLKRPQLHYRDIAFLNNNEEVVLPAEVIEEVEVTIKYEGYLKKQAEQVARFQRLENRVIPKNFDYEQLQGLSFEAKEKLKRFRPTSLGQASRISGVSPADLTILNLYLDRKPTAS